MLEGNINYINKTTEDMIGCIEAEIGKDIAIDLLPKIVKLANLQSEFQLGRLTNLVRLTSNTIKDRVRRNTNTRTVNLVNNFNSSYETVDKLNKKTCGKNVITEDECFVIQKIKKAA